MSMYFRPYLIDGVALIKQYLELSCTVEKEICYVQSRIPEISSGIIAGVDSLMSCTRTCIKCLARQNDSPRLNHCTRIDNATLEHTGAARLYDLRAGAR